MNTTESNKLIAEFMGVGIEDNNIIIDFDKHPDNFHHTLCVFEGVANSPIYELDERVFKFHCSWDWLMPVVDKIETVKNQRVNVNIGTGEIAIFLHNKKAYENKDYHKYDFYVSKYKNNKLEATYEAVVEFIKWYNEKISARR